MDDSARVCGYCGTAFDSSSENNFKYEDPEKKAKFRKTVKKIVTAIATVAIFSIVVSIASSFVGYRGAIRTFMNAYKTGDAEALAAMTWSVAQEEDMDSIIRFFDNELKKDLDRFDSYFNSKYRIKYEIANASKLSDRQIEKIKEQIVSADSSLTEEADSVKKMMSVKVAITAKSGSASTSVSRTIYLLKESGKWKIFTFE